MNYWPKFRYATKIKVPRGQEKHTRRKKYNRKIIYNKLSLLRANMRFKSLEKAQEIILRTTP